LSWGGCFPFADPVELQLPRLAQKIFVGAQFIVTQPVFDLERFGLWWKQVVGRDLHTKAAFIAGIRVLSDADTTRSFVERGRSHGAADMLKRLSSNRTRIRFAARH